MGLSNATLAGLRATSARVNLGAWGCWYADASLDGEHALAGRVTLQIADLTLQGCVLSGGVAKGRSDYRIVAGAGGWGKLLPAKSYATDAGVSFATILGDAATACGETLATIDPSLRTGPGFVRLAGPASAVLEQLAPGGWYVDEAGVTHLGKRTVGKLPTVMTRTTPVDLARRTLTLASESIATILPGVSIDGLAVVDVEHTVDAKAGLRSKVWGSLGGSSSRDLDALRKLLAQLDPDRAFRGLTEYRVVTLSGKRLNLQSVRPASSGMPNLANVRIMPGVAGCDAAPALGSRVLVGFIDSDQSRPVALAFEDAEGAGFSPVTLAFLKGTSGVARVGDEITISSAQILASGANASGFAVALVQPLKGTISSGSTKVSCG